MTLLVLLAGSGYLIYTFLNRQASSKGSFSQSPILIQDYRAEEFSLSSLRPILGAGNSTQPQVYDQTRVAAGKDSQHNGVVFQLSENGTSSWAVNLGAPLISCSATAIGDDSTQGSTHLLPCLYQGKDSTGVALIDLNAGSGKWIWQAKETYINIGVQEDKIILIDQDLSITQISTSGAMLTETLLSQPAADADLAPDLGSCNLGQSGTIESPEGLQLYSTRMWVLTHNGVNYFINPTNNQILAALPGRILKNPDDTIWTVSPSSQCTSSATVQPQRARITLLPQNLTVPATADGTVPNYVQRDGELYGIFWDSLRVSKRAFTNLNLKLSGDTQLFETEDQLYLSSAGRLQAIDTDTSSLRWSFSEDVQNFWVYQDTLIYNSKDTALKAVSTAEGIELWDLPEAEATFFLASSDSETLAVSGTSSIRTYAKADSGEQSLYHGSPSSQTEATPGVTYDSGECVRVEASAKTGSTQTVTFVKVDCSLGGAEAINFVISTATLGRGAPVGQYLDKCLAQDPDTLSALTVTSMIANPNVSALCTK